MARVVHFEMHVDDPERAQRFYSTVFGWEFTLWDGPQEYWLIKTGENDEPGINGGMLRRMDPGGAVYNTLIVGDLERLVEQVESNGGTVVVPKMAVPKVGWLAYFKDTEGNIFGMMQPDETAG